MVNGKPNMFANKILSQVYVKSCEFKGWSKADLKVSEAEEVFKKVKSIIISESSDHRSTTSQN